ncbi:MAG: glycosyltransferase [Candidatus Falkowbacteria bacterium]
MLSIITPNLNNAKYLEDNILSISKLNIPFEHIIVDGGSTDGSLDIILKYPQIKLLHQTEKTGMYGAIHQGFSEAKGEYITWVNADDRIITAGFEAMYLEISKGVCDFIYSDGYYYYVKENIQKFGKGRRFGKFFLKHGCMPTMQPSSIYTKNLYLEIGGLRYDKFKIIGDLDLFLRMAKLKKCRFKYIRALSTVFSNRDDSLGNSNSNLYYKELADNQMPKPNLLVSILYRIFKYI